MKNICLVLLICICFVENGFGRSISATSCESTTISKFDSNILLADEIINYSTDSSKPVFKMSSSIGLRVPIGTLKKGLLTDALLGYDDRGWNWRSISASYFFKPSWSVQMTIEVTRASDLKTLPDDFIQGTLERFPDYVLISFFSTPPAPAPDPNVNLNVYIGVLKHLFFKKFTLSPKFQFGLSHYEVVTPAFTLKALDNNRYLTGGYRINKRTKQQEMLTFIIGNEFSVPLNEKWAIQLVTDYYYFQSNLIFQRSFTDTFSGETTTTDISYQKPVHGLSVTIGLQWTL